MAPGQNRTLAAAVGGKRSHYCVMPAPQLQHLLPAKRYQFTGSNSFMDILLTCDLLQ